MKDCAILGVGKIPEPLPQVLKISYGGMFRITWSDYHCKYALDIMLRGTLPLELFLSTVLPDPWETQCTQQIVVTFGHDLLTLVMANFVKTKPHQSCQISLWPNLTKIAKCCHDQTSSKVANMISIHLSSNKFTRKYNLMHSDTKNTFVTKNLFQGRDSTHGPSAWGASALPILPCR